MTDQTNEAETELSQEKIDRFNRDLQVECRELWRQVYAATLVVPRTMADGLNISAHEQPHSRATDYNIVTTVATDNFVNHVDAAHQADVAVHNYKTMVSRKLHGNSSTSYTETIPRDPPMPVAPDPVPAPPWES